MPESQETFSEVVGSGENYRAYLLRCWQEKEVEPGRQSAWRFTLVQLGGNQTKRGFANLENLMNFLDMALAKTEHANSEGE